MATRSANRSSSSRSRSRSTSSGGTSANGRSAFRWGSTGAIAGAALGGAALAIAANLGRKFLSQALVSGHGNWAESLAQEHQAVLALFDRMLETDETQTTQRKMLLMKLGYALDKHAYAEEHVVYPALREANETAEAEELETEHGQVKEFLYRLNHMSADDPAWIDTVREFRASVEAHARMEEDQVFPRLRGEIDEELDARITKEVKKAEFMMS
ncbi:MAG TPA: hemerythrin domain-containing protein [Sphingomicrobium sp.]|nr:hemerythrin domain-containing protein [Sphingomicrobium sp.]